MSTREFNWFNYTTGDVEVAQGYPPADRLHEFIPQSPAAQTLYRVYQEQGDSPEVAFGKVTKEAAPVSMSDIGTLRGLRDNLDALLNSGVCPDTPVRIYSLRVDDMQAIAMYEIIPDVAVDLGTVDDL